jgi:hypothetical protein
MACHPRVTAWPTILQTHLPPWTKPHATVVALGSLGLVLARAWALTAVRACRAPWLGRTAPPGRQPVRALGSAVTATRGTARGARGGEPCCEPRLAWGVGPWEGTPWALALAAPTWGARLTGVALRLGSRGCALPVAWTVLAAPAPHAGRREWWRLLRQGRRAVPRSWPVRGRAERGMYARGRLRRLTRLGWPPFWRLHPGGPLRPQGQGRGGALQTWGPEPGPAWQGTGSAVQGRHRQRHGTRLAGWEAGDPEPWGRLPALPPEARPAWWYGWRAWSEQGLQSTTRAGWPWPRTPMTKPDRAARLRRAVAVATLWLRRVGGAAEATLPVRTVPDVTALVPGQPRTRPATRLRRVRVCRRGGTLILVAVRDQAPLPLGRFVPEPWPAVPVPEAVPPALPGLAVPQAA